MDNGFFRKKNIKKISSPEKLDDYIRVTTPSVWIALADMILLLTGALIWGIVGRVSLHDSDGTAKTVAPITFFVN